MDSSSPRVNSALLPKCNGKNVRLVGKVLAVNPGSGEALFEACDQGQVTVHMIPGSPVSEATGKIVEVLGRVQPNLSIQEAGSTVFEKGWDPTAYNKMVTAAMEHDALFGWWK
ncbi:replication factor A protein 3 [Fimicolochytrium jonesii]|uniref:replication factor A protein 3 n=1 Tax=Fimicolochytrium jonesii TaxID=1396493 RepID=UPI0022FDCA0C|nr:replication factor A protein 3 [Fimicolochytrium jonesii]KAI8815806.1 replication factor A protein 3 [Fimicolochytrium jonesii]